MISPQNQIASEVSRELVAGIGGKLSFVEVESPTSKPTSTLWNTRPLFVWRGFPRSVALQVVGTNTVLRQATSFVKQPFGFHTIPHAGEPLQPGQSYQLSFFDPRSQKIVYRYSFKLMDAAEREPITRDLQNLETQLRATNASHEAIALQRAQYFAERDMLADVLQEMYSVENPSDDLKKAIREIQSEIYH